ncbi:hypothetical protein [Stenomitos frigidus]|uniref:Uncharacterized protein n=1 Tax=Stenomitos frigidus ULC18 TaxID=2107698 RepID=A0A2T1DW83_9CYAN|nr:hypothetical protein [Stenomitos frigidus]PSB24729.1 hypothetical protein C7B82_25285 [Stenomitos frigidus ULC18]
MTQLTRKHPSTNCPVCLGKRAQGDRAGLVSRLAIGRLLIGCFTLAGVATIFLPDRLLSAEPTPVPTAPSPAVKPETPAPVPAAKQILGQWLAKEPLEGDTVMFVFAPDGKAFILTGTSASGNAIASQFQYRLDAKPQPMHLDIVLIADVTVETLFEFTANGDLRLQMLGTRPGKPRPKALTDNATIFQKVSDETILPPGTELKQTSTPAK